MRLRLKTVSSRGLMIPVYVYILVLRFRNDSYGSVFCRIHPSLSQRMVVGIAMNCFFRVNCKPFVKTKCFSL